MGPKAKQTARATPTAKTDAICIKGWSGKDLANEIGRALPKYLQRARDYYCGKNRYNTPPTTQPSTSPSTTFSRARA